MHNSEYLYAHANPVNHIDPSGNEIEEVLAIVDFGGILAQTSESAVAAVAAAVAPPEGGSWVVEESDVDLSLPDVSSVALAYGNPKGFWVTYKSTIGACKNGKIVLYQIVSHGSSPPSVDCKLSKAPTTGDPLPPRMTPQIPGIPTSYEDSPGVQTLLGDTTWKCTAVAVCRTKLEKGGDQLLSTYYFEFSNNSRKIKKADPDNRTQYDTGMKRWWGE